MDSIAASQIVGQVVTASGVLVGLLAVFLGIVPERRRRKIELLDTLFYELEQKRIDASILHVAQSATYLGNIGAQQTVIMQLKERLKQSLKVGGIPVNIINYGHLIYIAGIFVVSISYFSSLSGGGLINESLIYDLVIATCIGFGFIVPVSYWTAIKDYDLTQ